SAKLPAKMNKRVLEEEGLYVRERPHVSKKQMNRMENRLLKEGKHWFGEDGNMIALPDPVRHSWNHKLDFPFLNDDLALKAEYVKARVNKPEHSVMLFSEMCGQVCQLDLNISSLIFTHHPLFSPEHVLASKLIQLYDSYQSREQRNVTVLMSEKLQALRHAERNLRMNVKESSAFVKKIKSLEQQVRVVQLGFRETQKMYDKERQTDLLLMKNIILTWNHIKSLRRFNKYVSTKVKLQVTKINKLFLFKLNCNANNFLQVVIRRELEQGTDSSPNNGYHPKETGNLKVVGQKNAGANQFLQKSRNCDQEIEISQVYTCEDLKKLEDCETPYQAATFQNIQKERVSEKWQRPREPILVPVLTMNEVVTPMQLCPHDEQKRRWDVQKHKLIVNIFCNEKHVSSSKKINLNNDFRVDFQQIFSILIINCPEYLRLEVSEFTHKDTNVLANIYVPFPDRNLLSSNAKPECSEFSSDRIVAPQHEGVGSNVLFHLDKREPAKICLLTSGKLLYSLSWAVDKDGFPMAPSMPQTDSYMHTGLSVLNILSATQKTWRSNKGNLLESIKHFYFDPNDPTNVELTELIKQSTGDSHPAPDYFRLGSLQEEFSFVTDEQLRESKRFRLLELRNLDVFEFSGLKQVPLHDGDISDSMFEQKRTILKVTKNKLAKEFLFSHLHLVTNFIKFVEKVLKQTRKRLARVKKRYKLSDIVTEYQDAENIVELNFNMFKRAHPLKPRRENRKSIPAHTLRDGDLKIHVGLRSAQNIPVRKQTLLRSDEMLYYAVWGGQYYLAQVQVRPSAEITFQESVHETITANGPNPYWNEDFFLDFKSVGGDYRLSSLSKIKDNIIINVFDEISLEVKESNTLKGCSLQTYSGKQWLGCVVLPFTSILQQSKVNNILRISTPPVLLGYTWSTEENFPDMRGSENESCFLSVFVTLDPPVSVKEDATGKILSVKQFPTSEDRKLLEMVYAFEKQCKAANPERRVVTTVVNEEGKKILATRFIKPLPPPPELLHDDMDTSSDHVVSFVSLIPLLPFSTDVGEECEMWITSEQCIHLAVGNRVSLAILLCNYFLYLGKKAWLILGTSVLKGETAYVLTQEMKKYILWNPSDGKCFEQFDMFCPLKTVDCLINGQNIWFNSADNSVMSMCFDVSKDSSWKPLFPSDFVLSEYAPLQTKHNYFTSNMENVKQLQKRIEKTLKKCIMDWRVQHRTRWNHQCIALLQEFLTKLEHYSGASIIEEESRKIYRKMKEYKVTGFPLHIPYVDMETVIETVYSTRIHSTEIPETEFALAVYINPYPNNILSLWIFLAALVKH
uniref:C2 domain-containing protein n=1 Tax=Lepisosteus oculatus TaxID=7918 RepID=W5MK02_LEPOC